MQIVAIALEHAVLLDVDLDEQIARRTAVQTRLAVAGRADAHAVIDAGRDLHFERLGLLDLARAVAIHARLGDIAAGAMAFRAGLLDAEETLRHPHCAAATAGRANLGLGARLRAVAMADVAGRPARHADLRLIAVRRLLERDLHAVAQVRATIDLRAAARTAALPAPAATGSRLTEDIA